MEMLRIYGRARSGAKVNGYGFEVFEVLAGEEISSSTVLYGKRDADVA